MPPVTPVASSADLTLSKTLLTASPAPAGSTVTYQVVVSNAGPASVVGATVSDTVPPELADVTWTCAASAGSACGTASGSGNAISVSADIAAGGSVTLTISGTAPASGTIGANTATVTPPPGTDDPTPGDNTDTVPEIAVVDLPAAVDDAATTAEDTPTTIAVLANDDLGTEPTTVSVDPRYGIDTLPSELLSTVVDDRESSIMRFRSRGEPLLAVGVAIPDSDLSYFQVNQLEDIDTAHVQGQHRDLGRLGLRAREAELAGDRPEGQTLRQHRDEYHEEHEIEYELPVWMFGGHREDREHDRHGTAKARPRREHQLGPREAEPHQ